MCHIKAVDYIFCPQARTVGSTGYFLSAGYGPYKHATAHNGTMAPMYIKICRKPPKIGNNYGIGFMVRIGLVFTFSDTQRHYAAVVCFIWTPQVMVVVRIRVSVNRVKVRLADRK